MTTIIDCQNCEGTGQASEMVSVRVNDTYVQDSIDEPCNVIDCVEGRIEVEVEEHFHKEIAEVAVALTKLEKRLKSDNCKETEKVIQEATEWLLND
jgi:hypothetical protein